MNHGPRGAIACEEGSLDGRCTGVTARAGASIASFLAPPADATLATGGAAPFASAQHRNPRSWARYHPGSDASIGRQRPLPRAHDPPLRAAWKGFRFSLPLAK